MKPKPFFIARWWNDLNLQVRLFLLFTVLFVFCVLTLSVFLFNVVRMISLNNQASAVFEQNRQVYQLKALTEQYELDLNQYEINSSIQAQEEMVSLGERLNETAAALRLRLPEVNTANLDQFLGYLKQINLRVDQIVTAVDSENWEKVTELDNQVYLLIEPMFTEINTIADRGLAELQTVKDEAQTLSLVAFISGLLAAPVFLFLFVLVALVVYLQINQPLNQLRQATQDLENGKFEPAQIEDLAGGGAEIGMLGREFIAMAGSLGQRAARLEQEAGEIRAKIH